MKSIESLAPGRATFPLEHYRQAILCREAYPWARRYLASLQSDGVHEVMAEAPLHLQRSVQLIAEAVRCGWFVVPNGKNGTFSARQFAERGRMAAALPWVPDILQRALEAEARARHHRPAERYTFGVRRLPGFVDQALGLPHRLPRLPLDHQAGAITAELWFQVLADVHAATAALAAQIECVAPAWMWDPAASLEHQVERLRQHGCAHLLIAYVSQTRDHWIDSPEQKKLEDVLYRGLPVVEYERWYLERAARARAEEEGRWRALFARIRELAGIFDDARSFARIPLGRLIRELSGGRFTLQREANSNPGLVVEVAPNYLVGGGEGIDEPFALANFCQALADALADVPCSFPGYLEACRQARASLIAFQIDTAAPCERAG
ncbi:hypothetical protein [Pseudomonas oryzihabitans]|uniref:Uncharacterized protein n=1 Tax=Pseudomonas oryzihabitans TaxID=47885 RepID=A0ABX3ITP6_9PSED|nr:hypothetical protein [Pseudomonas psychrotolerans]ONN71204.1 hypothetical protein BVL52_11965 [Pseudomonas psychrotolerans]